MAMWMAHRGDALINLDDARRWLGRVDIRSDHAGSASLAALFATLDRDDPPATGEPLPPLGHWLYFIRPERRSEIGEDGNGRGAFLPPIELPRRTCVSSRLQFHRPLRVGDAISRVSCIADIGQEPGRAGPLVSVLVRHEIADAEGIALTEHQRIAFRDRAEPATAAGPDRPRGAPVWSQMFHADERTLFRYAALTFDARRIHYDRPYATFVAGHPGLVVQAGLVATLLLDLLRRHAPHARLSGYEFRTLQPLFDIEPFCLRGRPRDWRTAELWAENLDGAVAMTAIATLDGDTSLAGPERDGASLSAHASRKADGHD